VQATAKKKAVGVKVPAAKVSVENAALKAALKKAEAVSVGRGRFTGFVPSLGGCSSLCH
jgi:hypothetical protein